MSKHTYSFFFWCFFCCWLRCYCWFGNDFFDEHTYILQLQWRWSVNILFGGGEKKKTQRKRVKQKILYTKITPQFYMLPYCCSSVYCVCVCGFHTRAHHSCLLSLPLSLSLTVSLFCTVFMRITLKIAETSDPSGCEIERERRRQRKNNNKTQMSIGLGLYYV